MSTESEDAELIEEIAANWLAEREEGLSLARAREFERWCRQDPRHAAEVARLEHACALLEKMPLVRGELQPVVEFPASARTVLAPPAARPHRGGRRLLAGLAAIIALAAMGWWQWPRVEAENARHVTSAGGYERVVLPDGSVMELNAHTEVHVAFTARERQLALMAGEAHFSVVRDAARPFIVAARGVAVRAVGTAFNVRVASEAIEVIVTQGRVRLGESTGATPVPSAAPPAPSDGGPRPDSSGMTLELGAGERAVIPLAQIKGLSAPATPAAIERMAPSALQDALAWQERKLVFSETPLRDVVMQFNRRNRLQLVIGDPALAERPVGGTFAVDNVDGFIRLLEASGTVVVERRGNEIVLRSAR